MPSRSFGFVFCILIVFLAVSPAAAADLNSLRDAVERAVVLDDVAALEAAAAKLEDVRGEWADYYRAYAQYRLGIMVGDDDKKRTKEHLNTCIDILEAAIEEQPDNAEMLALQGSCYGTSSAYYMLAAATRGSASDKAMKRALELAPENPRVLLQDGISLFYRPGMFGGDKELALKRFQDAAGQFESWQSPETDAPDWGRAEAWLYLGRAYRELEQPEQAREAYRQALQLAPDYKLAQEELAELQ